MTLPQTGSDTFLSPKLWTLKAPTRSAADPTNLSTQTATSRIPGPPMAEAERVRDSLQVITLTIPHQGLLDLTQALALGESTFTHILQVSPAPPLPVVHQPLSL